MDSQIYRTRQPFSEGFRLPYVSGLALLLILVAFQFWQIHSYREIIAKNDVNARLLSQALGRLTQVDDLSRDLKNTNDLADTLKTESGELKRTYLVWKQQLNTIAVAQSTMSAALEDVKRSQEAERTKTAVLNTFSLKHTYGQNIFVGVNAGSVLKNHAVAEGDDPNIASFNAALGENALAANQQGHSNTAVGADALGTNNDGIFNVATGARALASNTTGSGNVAVGAAAMYRNVSGQHNSAFGLQALYRLEEGHDNSAFGRDSMFSTKQGSWNAAFGVDSLPGLEEGQGNSAFGGEAGYTNEPSFQLKTGSFNSWFGYQAGPASLKQVNNSIAIGYRAKNTNSNQTVIGNSETAETVIFGDVKVNTICVGSTCADAQSFKALLDKARRDN